MNYLCNCLLENGFLAEHETEVDKEGICVYCGNYARWGEVTKNIKKRQLKEDIDTPSDRATRNVEVFFKRLRKELEENNG